MYRSRRSSCGGESAPPTASNVSRQANDLAKLHAGNRHRVYQDEDAAPSNGDYGQEVSSVRCVGISCPSNLLWGDRYNGYQLRATWRAITSIRPTANASTRYRHRNANPAGHRPKADSESDRTGPPGARSDRGNRPTNADQAKEGYEDSSRRVRLFIKAIR